MTQIISKPDPEEYSYEVSGFNQEFGFGYYETMGGRDEQEDALAWHILDPKDLTPQNASEQLTPPEIGHRLWTSYQILDTPDLESGTTAATTIYDGQGNFITATLADAASFAVIYDKEGNALGVTRLNSVTHKPSDQSEKERIEAAEGLVISCWGCPRVDGYLAISRAIGDNFAKLKTHGVCSEATVDITNAETIARDLGIASTEIGFIQIINTCDGFTDGAGRMKQSKNDHEEYLLTILQDLKCPGKLPQNELAKTLADKALRDGSRDNVSIAIQTITDQTPAVLVGVYDGHGGIEASSRVADKIGRVFKEQCALTPAQYAKQKLSVERKRATYKRDNNWDTSLEQLSTVIKDLYEATKNYQKNLNINSKECQPIVPIINKLMQILECEQSGNKEKLRRYYSFLDQPHLIDDETTTKNIDVIRKDTRRSALDLLAGMAVIAATLVTGILPGLLIIGIVYAATGKTPLDLLKSYGNKFEEKTIQIRAGSGLSFDFFKPATTTSPKQHGDLADDIKDEQTNTNRKSN